MVFGSLQLFASGVHNNLLVHKDDFLRLVTHELRRPLGLINGYLPMILEGDLGPVPNKMQLGLRVIQAGVAEMGVLIDGLVKLAYLEDHNYVLNREPTYVSDLVRDAVAATEPETMAKRIRVEQYLPDPKIQVLVDSSLCRVGVINLIENAIKYSPEESTIRVTARVGSELTIDVTDQGPGIEPAKAERIFEQWQRATTTIAPGLGLGLYIVRKVVELHGGRIILDSKQGKGSTFTIILPR